MLCSASGGGRFAPPVKADAFAPPVKADAPRADLIENAPGLVSFGGGKTLRAILDSLEALGCGAAVKILAAPHCGVPGLLASRRVSFFRGLAGW